MALTVHAGFAGGNVADVSIADHNGVAEIGFAPHPHGGPETLWFHFRIENGNPAKTPERTVLCLKNPGNMLGGRMGETLRPVIRFSGGEWLRMGPPHIEMLPDGRNNAVWSIETPTTWAEVAVCYPYGVEQLSELVGEVSAVFHADVIGLSQGGRPLTRLANDYGSAGGSRPGVYLVGRQHSGETPGSWMMDGFLRHMATLGPAAPLVWAVPLSNVDGVVEGDYGKDNFPYDLNRAWGRPPMRHETLVLQEDMRRWKGRCRGMAVIDFHAPGAGETDGVYFFVPDPEKAKEASAAVVPWTDAIRESLTEAYAAGREFARVGRYPSRWTTSTLSQYAWAELGVVGLSMETTYGLAQDGRLVMTREDYREAGKRVAMAVVRMTAA